MPGPVVARLSRHRVEWAYGGPASEARREGTTPKEQDPMTWWRWGSVTSEVMTVSHDWLTPILTRLDDLAKLPTGWDGDDAVPPTALAVIGAIRCLHSLDPTLFMLPAIAAGAEGGLALEWHAGGVDAEVEIPARGGVEDVELYVRYVDAVEPVWDGTLEEGASYLQLALQNIGGTAPLELGDSQVSLDR